MDVKLDSLIEKIKQEGIEEAQRAADEIRQKAEAEAQEIINKANEKARQIINGCNQNILCSAVLDFVQDIQPET